MYFFRLFRKKAEISPIKHHQEETDEDEQLDESSECESNPEKKNIDKASGYNLLNEYLVKMINITREFTLCCIFVMVYAAITKDDPKVSKPPAAYPFFPSNSLVIDNYQGQMLKHEQGQLADFSFLMFYAPWDRNSQAARKELELTAEYLQNSVVFFAINCWQPFGLCQNQSNKVYKWPIFMAYPAHGAGVQYNGPLSAPYMIQFLKKVIRPLKVVKENISEFEEAFVVAELNVLPGSKEYSIYYSAALKYLEIDPLSQITFYVKPVPKSTYKLLLYVWNGIREIELQSTSWHSEIILQLIVSSTSTDLLSKAIMPSGSKSKVLSKHLQSGPSLILFSPKNPLLENNDYYLMFQEISQEYKNCDNQSVVFDFRTRRHENRIKHQHLEKKCAETNEMKYPINFKSDFITTNAALFNSTNQVKYLRERSMKMDYNMIDLYSTIKLSADDKNVENEHYKYSNCFSAVPDSYLYNNRNYSKLFYKTSMLDQTSDKNSMFVLRSKRKKEICKNFRAAKKVHEAIFEQKQTMDFENLTVTGLACYNQSLEFITMNSLLYSEFAERLGIDISNKKDKSAIVIVNEKLDTHYIMDIPITNQNLRKFIRNFTINQLIRSVNSSVDVKSRNSLSYTFNSSKNYSEFQIEELTNKNFLSRISQPNKAVIVLYYSKQCTHCSGISYVFLTVARKLSLIENIKFYRIEGDLNLLPWQYTMERFPTIMFFPENRKEESRVFPQNLAITVTNLLGFLFNNLNCSLKLQAMHSCCLHQSTKDQSRCFSTLRNETLFLINQTLKDWRKANNRQRQILMYKLIQLRQLQFLFNNPTKNLKLIEKMLKNVQSQTSEDYNENFIENINEEL